jgi:hypothetical protein
MRSFGRLRRFGAVITLVATVLGLGCAELAQPAGAISGRAAAVQPRAGKPLAAAPALTSTPLFAYYYQWFDPNSWNRAKVDYPQLGRYSSDDVGVMRQQIEWAKQSGISGFIVSWKSTAVNNRRLEALVKLAAVQKFRLAMIYQGLDFNRQPLPASRVAADFKFFAQHFARNPVFYRMGGKALTIWSGTWEFSAPDVAAVTTPVRSSLLVLSTEKSVAGYQRIAQWTDGDAYYWSSVNPQTNSGYAAKLDDMSRAIHLDQKYWIAPFAPGFDARLVGGEQRVDRRDGQTMRTEYATALSSSPDALGLISWNEFSENTYVEPSKKYGNLFIRLLGQLRQASPPALSAGIDSSDPAGPGSSSAGWPAVLRLPLFVLGLIGCVTALGWSRRRWRRPPPEHPQHQPEQQGKSFDYASRK